MNASLIDHEGPLEDIVRVLKALRTHLSETELMVAIRAQATATGYRLATVCDEQGKVLCVAGFVIQHKLAWGKSLYVDDLVTTPEARSTGAGKCMLDWLKAHARANGCSQMHLDSGVQRFDAHRFYLREGFRIASHHFSIDLDSR